MAASLALLALTAASAVRAAVTPTAPGPGDVFQAGGVCRYSYTPDPTGTWKNVSIDLMTGSNFNMVLVENIASNLDGTSAGGASGSGTFTCPQVTPNAAIYFLQFTNNGADPTWTTRFTIASSSGATVAAPSTTRTAGSTIGFGFGSLVGGQTSAGAASASAGASNSSGASSGGASVVTQTASAVTVTSTGSSNSPSSGSSTSDSGSGSGSSSASSGSGSGASAASSATRSAASSTGSSKSGAAKVGGVFEAGVALSAGLGLAALLL